MKRGGGWVLKDHARQNVIRTPLPLIFMIKPLIFDGFFVSRLIISSLWI